MLGRGPEKVRGAYVAIPTDSYGLNFYLGGMSGLSEDNQTPVASNGKLLKIVGGVLAAVVIIRLMRGAAQSSKTARRNPCRRTKVAN